MRRTVGLVLAGLGAFLLVVAALLSTYLPSRLIKDPLNEYLVTQLVGHDVSYFSPHLVRPVTGATMVVTATVKGVPTLGNSSTSVWDEFTYIYDQTNHVVYQYSNDRFAFNRRTAQIVNCCGANVGGNSSKRMSGVVGLVWPFGAQRTTYQVFDPGMDRSWPTRYVGTSTIDGITVYRYVERVPGVPAGKQTLPASLVGMKGTGEVTLPERYAATNTFFVDPTTGAPLNQILNQKVTLVDSSGAQRLLLLQGSMTFTPQSLQKVVNADRSARSKISLLTMIIPLAAGLLGLVVLITGIVLSRRPPDRGQHSKDAPATEPVMGPAV